MNNRFEKMIEEADTSGNSNMPGSDTNNLGAKSWSGYGSNPNAYRAQQAARISAGITGEQPQMPEETDAPKTLPWPMDTIFEYLSQAYLNMSNANNLINTSLSKNGSLDEAEMAELERFKLEAAELKLRIRHLGKNLEIMCMSRG